MSKLLLISVTQDQSCNENLILDHKSKEWRLESPNLIQPRGVYLLQLTWYIKLQLCNLLHMDHVSGSGLKVCLHHLPRQNRSHSQWSFYLASEIANIILCTQTWHIQYCFSQHYFWMCTNWFVCANQLLQAPKYPIWMCVNGSLCV